MKTIIPLILFIGSILCAEAGTTVSGGGVTQIIPGSNVTVSPSNGVGAVTVSASGGGGGSTTLTGDVTGTGTGTVSTTVNAIKGTTVAASVATAAGNAVGANGGFAGISTANVYTQPQVMEGIQNTTGPFNVWLGFMGDSRLYGKPSATWSSQVTNYLGTAQWPGIITSPAAQMATNGFAYNGSVLNSAFPGTGIEEGIIAYAGIGNVTTTGNISGSSITSLASTTGISSGMFVAGPGIVPGTTITLSGSTATLSTSSFLATNSASVNFYSGCYALGFNATGLVPSMHQVSPAVNTATYTCTVTSGSNVVTLNSGSWTIAEGSTITSTHFPGGTATVIGYPAPSANQVYVSTNATGSSGSEAVTIKPFAICLNNFGINNFETPYTFSGGCTNGSPTVTFTNLVPLPVVGSVITEGTDFPANTTLSSINVTSYSQSGATGSYTASNNFTGSTGSKTITVTQSATAFETRYAYLMSLMTADGFTAEACTIFKAWGGIWSAGDSERQAVNTWERSTYGSETSAPTNNLGLIDLDAMPIFASNDPTVYAIDGFNGLHLTNLGSALETDHINTILGVQFPALSGHPLPRDKNVLESFDKLLPPYQLVVGNGSTNNPLIIAGSGTQAYIGFDGTGDQHAWFGYQTGGNVGFFFNQGRIALLNNVNGSNTTAAAIPAVPTGSNATVSGSTSPFGSATFTETYYGTLDKRVVINCSALVGTASFTFPTAFTNTPVVVTTSGLSSSLVTTLNTTTVTVTGATSTGLLFIEGY